MLFQVSWNVESQNRMACWNAFGNMTAVDDLKDAGDDIKVRGRWHHLGGGGGTCICECTSAAALNAWMLNWGGICNITVVPVVNDADARKSLQEKSWFQTKVDPS